MNDFFRKNRNYKSFLIDLTLILFLFFLIKSFILTREIFLIYWIFSVMLMLLLVRTATSKVKNKKSNDIRNLIKLLNVVESFLKNAQLSSNKISEIVFRGTGLTLLEGLDILFSQKELLFADEKLKDFEAIKTGYSTNLEYVYSELVKHRIDQSHSEEGIAFFDEKKFHEKVKKFLFYSDKIRHLLQSLDR